MTRKQFFKKSEKVVKESANNLLQLSSLLEKEKKEQVNIDDALKKLDILRRNIENIFNDYERIKPPSECLLSYKKILNFLVLFQEMISENGDYLLLTKKDPKISDKLKISLIRYEELRTEFEKIKIEIKKIES